MNIKTMIVKPIAAAVGVAFVSSLVFSSTVVADDNPFASTDLDTGYMLAGGDKNEEGKCGEAKCGGDTGEEGSGDDDTGEEGSGDDDTGEEGSGDDDDKGEEGSCGGDKGEEGSHDDDKGEEGSCGGDKE